MSLFVSGGGLIMVGGGWSWVVLVKSWLEWWRQKYVPPWVPAEDLWLVLDGRMI